MTFNARVSTAEIDSDAFASIRIVGA